MAVIFRTLSDDPNVRVVVMSGAGDKAFTTGLDVKSASLAAMSRGAVDPARTAVSNLRHIRDFQSCITAISECSKPVIVLYHGYSYGLAVDIGCAADIRISTDTTRFAVKEVDIGLAADIGTLTRLPKVCGGSTSWVKEICLSAREFTSAEALSHGFVSKVVRSKPELLAEGLKMAELIAGKSPVAVQGTKRILDYGYGRTVEEGLEYTAVWNAGMLQTDDVMQAVQAGLQKRKPTFEKL